MTACRGDILRCQQPSNAEDAQQGQTMALERRREKPKEFLTRQWGNQLVLMGWLATTAVIGLITRVS